MIKRKVDGTPTGQASATKSHLFRYESSFKPPLFFFSSSEVSNEDQLPNLVRKIVAGLLSKL